jgi:cation transport ATPase
MLQVDGMVCAAGALKVEEALRTLPGVETADVSAGRRSARVALAGFQHRRGGRLTQWKITKRGWTVPIDNPAN